MERVTMERVTEQVECEYEAFRRACMLDNQACVALESLGAAKTVSQYQQQVDEQQALQLYEMNDNGLTPVRRSTRISNKLKASLSQPSTSSQPPRITSKPSKITSKSSKSTSIIPQPLTINFPQPLFNPAQDKVSLHKKRKRPAKTTVLDLLDGSAKRCDSKGRGSVYDPVVGICCHFCRQKKLCGEEDCKRCGNLDVNEPCMGKTNCSACNSSTGVFCRACLKVRYGEEMDEVKKDTGWLCAHCLEKSGTRPYWICNSSICMRKRKIAPTGIAVYKGVMLDLSFAFVIL
ncbi:unnamed protein product [Sphenostylis stenocarpa]|uniref:Zinc-finger domain-containing protein n=1 Tax=Sphenostylis stenocarpa TaxID=92480 RepID=A0AA86VP03_9FABA|nr:unnamed protein product [Sphenostylis stenocarpa]